MSHPPFFHQPSGTVRFFTVIADTPVGGSISKETLHHRFRPDANGEDPMETFRSHAQEIEAAVRRRVANGSIEPVMLREFDLRLPA